MKKTFIAAALLALVSSALFAADADFGAQGAEGKKNLSLEQMLVYAIQDEYLARAEYAAIMERYGEGRPFGNIIRAEEWHIEWLKEVFAKHGLAVPADTTKSRLVVPTDRKKSLETGVQAEVDNIAMYDSFLGKAPAAQLPADVRQLFERLRAASENHLRAFRNNLSRYN
jgi:rubrerythrin